MTQIAATERKVHVELGERSYDILIGQGLIPRLGALISPHLKRDRVYIITDENVAGHHLETARSSLEQAGICSHVQVLPAGENTKNFSQLEAIIDGMMENGSDRKDIVLALGGGVVGDITGLAAGLMKRGMKFIQIPTTLLAQVDSSVGGKTAVNSRLGKNLIGLFNQPELVIADLDVLKTLPEREMRAGLAEVIKYGLIDDPSFFEFVESNAGRLLAGDTEALAYAVQASCEAKARIVSEDEKEQGKRALLNLGHTFGHALERASGFGPELLHGEAVGTGMAMAYRYSQVLGICNGQDAERAVRAIAALKLEPDVRKLSGGPYRADQLLEHMGHDKKTFDGKITLILAKGLGLSYIEDDVNAGHLMKFLETETA